MLTPSGRSDQVRLFHAQCLNLTKNVTLVKKILHFRSTIATVYPKMLRDVLQVVQKLKNCATLSFQKILKGFLLKSTSFLKTTQVN